MATTSLTFMPSLTRSARRKHSAAARAGVLLAAILALWGGFLQAVVKPAQRSDATAALVAAAGQRTSAVSASVAVAARGAATASGPQASE